MDQKYLEMLPVPTNGDGESCLSGQQKLLIFSLMTMIHRADMAMTSAHHLLLLLQLDVMLAVNRCVFT